MSSSGSGHDSRRRKGTKLKSIQSFIAILVILAISFVYNLFTEPSDVPSGNGELSNLQVIVLDIGQGSSALVRTNEKTILIDGGERGHGADLVEYFQKLDVQAIDLVIASHPHSDHIGGLAEMMGTVPVQEVMMPDVPDDLIPTNSTYLAFLDAIQNAHSTVTVCDRITERSLGDGVTLTVLGPFLNDPADLNDCSLVVRVNVGEASFLIMGDAEAACEDALRKRDVSAIDTDILVAGHHGSNTSSKQYFLNAATPKAVAISVGADNSYGLPHPKALDRLAAFGPIYRTDLNRSITFSTDGAEITVTAENINDTIDARG